MTESDRTAGEPKHFRASASERAPPPFEAAGGHRNRHHEINERRAQTENPDALRRLRSL